MPLLECKNVTLGYETGVAVQNVTFALEPGDYMCVVGENGSGKTTLMKGILGLIPVRSGEIRFHGISQREVGYLPQQTPVQRDFPASVFEVAVSGCTGAKGFRPFYTKAEKQRALDNLERVGLFKLQRRSYRALSAGQQQRVLMARALCATKRLLLLDEPVTGLDPLATADLYDLIKRLNREEGITIIMISHDVSCALHDANKVLHMGTEQVFFGTAEAYRKSEVSQRFLRCDCAKEARHA